MRGAKLHVLLNARLSEPWTAGVTVDASMLAGAAEVRGVVLCCVFFVCLDLVEQEWNALDTASSAVKVNVLLALLELRAGAVPELSEVVERLLALGEEPSLLCEPVLQWGFLSWQGGQMGMIGCV